MHALYFDLEEQNNIDQNINMYVHIHEQKHLIHVHVVQPIS